MLFQRTPTKINTFPHFNPLLQADYLIYQKFIKKFPQHCDFTPNNLLIWLDTSDGISYSWLNGNMVLKIYSSLLFSDTTEPMYTVIGDNKPFKTVKTLLNESPINCLQMVPDYFVDSLSKREKSKLFIQEDRDNWDYIIDIDSLVRKIGPKYEHFRYQIKYFLKNYSDDAVIRPIDVTSPAGIKAIVNALHSWPVVNSFTPQGNDPARADAQAISRLLGLQHQLAIQHQALGIYVSGVLQGFSIFHIPLANENIAMGNHIKFNGEYKRLFDMLAYATATTLKSQGVKLLNAEQDLGLEGIRRHKMDLNPIAFYKKYTIALL